VRQDAQGWRTKTKKKKSKSQHPTKGAKLCQGNVNKKALKGKETKNQSQKDRTHDPKTRHQQKKIIAAQTKKGKKKTFRSLKKECLKKRRGGETLLVNRREFEKLNRVWGGERGYKSHEGLSGKKGGGLSGTKSMKNDKGKTAGKKRGGDGHAAQGKKVMEKRRKHGKKKKTALRAGQTV